MDGLLKEIIKEKTKVGLEFNYLKEKTKVGLEFNYLRMIVYVMNPSCPATNWQSERGTSCDDLGMPSKNRRNPSHGPRQTK